MNDGQDGFVTISCRISKLGISEEALRAWHLEPHQYFLLLIRYTAGYKDLECLTGSSMSRGHSVVQMRVGVSARYKVACDEAIAAFAFLEDKRISSKLIKTRKEPSDKGSGLGRLFIGRPLDELMNDRLIPLLRYRVGMGFLWGGAEEFFNDHQGRNLSEESNVDPKYWAEDDSHHLRALPMIVTHDHLNDHTRTHSFPLLAMQYALRHLVRCTEFCLVCHCKVDSGFEALKPYVCSKPLCLYQYMSLGFGPSIEHEIITQPHVVDLLVSFCFTSACHQKLRNLPSGMALLVPPPIDISWVPHPISFPPKRVSHGSIDKSPTYKARLDQQKSELIFDTGSQRVLHPGNWITFLVPGRLEERCHCCVLDVLHPTVILGPPILKATRKDTDKDQPTSSGIAQKHLSNTNTANIPSSWTPATTPSPFASSEGFTSVQHPYINFNIYDQNFDDLDDYEKQGVIVMLLNTLPSVHQMGTYLRNKGDHDTSLRTWADRISPAALGLLRWIIASNRSCIIQVDALDGNSRKSEERVAGMPGWVQFRFAQGAPDKEQRFVTAVRDTTLSAKYPTLFAWHGSPLHNWHGIVREGLHFERADHGRAFGNGCYHSLHCSTSIGYSSGVYSSPYGARATDDSPRFGEWPQSQLRISQAIALNEIVNAPSQFVNTTPHLVVDKLDWIQSRYLFVKCFIPGFKIADTVPIKAYEQDPSYKPTGYGGECLVIPVTAVSKTRRPVSTIVKAGRKKVKVEDVQDPEEAAMVSDETEWEDIAILLSDEDDHTAESLPKKSKEKGKALSEAVRPQLLDKGKTDFVPGKLDHKLLPLLEPPSYATSMATKALQRELMATLKVQDTHPPHELGWYIDRELVSNVYQWIVELHSFETHLPLAQDMKSKGITSVVMEIRFGKDYPISPPFVRVIRPRFLSFMQGGGGHVTAGGALCMELLTNNGWSAVSNIESVLLQVRLAMSSTDPKPARLESGAVKDYRVGEAVEAFVRACQAHGVGIPSVHRSF